MFNHLYPRYKGEEIRVVGARIYYAGCESRSNNIYLIITAKSKLSIYHSKVCTPQALWPERDACSLRGQIKYACPKYKFGFLHHWSGKSGL